jgi:GNAT superfamily N-acetyltransferase
MTSVRQVQPAEAERLRELRLRALRTDPQAFAMTADEEAAEPLEVFASRIAGPGRAIFADEDFTGMAGALLAEDGDVELWGMWVDPARRGSGLATRLVDAVDRWAAEQGATHVALGVMNAADVAAFYERLGFTPAPKPERCDRWYRRAVAQR